MAVVIRMRRTGRRNRPCYRIAVTDSRKPRDGRSIETLGLYDPVAPRAELRLKLDGERARHWIEKGARPSETVNSILRREGVYEGLPKKAPRTRNRRTDTATYKSRVEAKQARAARKTERRDERVAARKAAAAAAAASSSEE
jgi:small subunit ribosomal protein S16